MPQVPVAWAGMAGLVFAAVLGAAVLHAAWNALAKAIPDPRVVAGLLSVAGLVLGAIGAAVLPPPAPGAWPYLVASAFLQAGYLLLLVQTYRYGEFGQVYPLARGLPPLLVTGFSLAVLGERLSGGQLAGVIVVSLALTALVFAGSRVAVGSGLGLAAATGVVIAAYTIVDGVGVRRADHPLSYIAWLFLLEGLLVLVVSRLLFGRGLWRASIPSAPLGLLGGVLAAVAYGTVLWAQSRAPLALVSALRETSLLFAGVIGTLAFGERFRPLRLAATVAAVAGIILIQAT
jgi:drug/metabolite transporter (DMT)-like permease